MCCWLTAEEESSDRLVATEDVPEVDPEDVILFCSTVPGLLLDPEPPVGITTGTGEEAIVIRVCLWVDRLTVTVSPSWATNPNSWSVPLYCPVEIRRRLLYVITSSTSDDGSPVVVVALYPRVLNTNNHQ